MIELRDIRIYVYNHASMKKVKASIPGLRKSIHRCNSIINAMQCIDIIRKQNPKNINKQFLICDFTDKPGGLVAQLYQYET